MLITTTNPRLDKILSGVCGRMPDGSGYSVATNTAGQLSNLATVLTTDYTGEWTVSFADQQGTGLRYADLLESLDDATEQAFLLSPGYIGADSEDLLFWLETVYGQPVTMANYGRVAQLFRLWYAATYPAEYHNPPDAPPAKYAGLTLAETPEARKERNRRLQASRRDRQTHAANRAGFDTIDKLAGALLAASDAQIAAIKAALKGL